jgi:hypothetical protein
MPSLSTVSIAPRARLPLILTTTYKALVTLNLLIHLLLGQNIVCILYSKCTSLTDAILFSPLTLAKGLICYLKYVDLSS